MNCVRDKHLRHKVKFLAMYLCQYTHQPISGYSQSFLLSVGEIFVWYLLSESGAEKCAKISKLLSAFVSTSQGISPSERDTLALIAITKHTLLMDRQRNKGERHCLAWRNSKQQVSFFSCLFRSFQEDHRWKYVSPKHHFRRIKLNISPLISF